MITGGMPPTLTEVWPEVAERLGRMLRHRGIDRPTAEDAVQETALKVVRAEVAFDGADDLFRWASVVAWRVAVDASRKQRRVELTALPDRPGPTNVALQVEQRTAVEAVGAGLRRLSAADRRALLDAPARGTGLSRQEAVRLNVRRHRARARLLALLEGMVGVLGWLSVRRHPKMARLAPVSAAMVVPLLSTGLVLIPHVAEEPRQRVTVAEYEPSRSARAPAEAPPPGAEPEPAPHAPPAAPAPVPEADDPLPAAPAGGDVAVRVPVTDGQIGSRARQPEDHDVCVDVTAAVQQCLDAPPLPVTPVPVPVPAAPTLPAPAPSTHVSARSPVGGIGGGLRG